MNSDVMASVGATLAEERETIAATVASELKSARAGVPLAQPDDFSGLETVSGTAGQVHFPRDGETRVHLGRLKRVLRML